MSWQQRALDRYYNRDRRWVDGTAEFHAVAARNAGCPLKEVAGHRSLLERDVAHKFAPGWTGALGGGESQGDVDAWDARSIPAASACYSLD